MKNKTSIAATLVTAFAAATSLGAIRAITPTAWNGDPNCWQMRRHAEKMQALVAQGGTVNVVFIGDSITHFWDSTGRLQQHKYFDSGDMRMLNLGTSADRTEHVLWRLTAGHELDGYEAKVIFLMIGTNNTGHFSAEEEPPADTILGIRKILRTIRAHQPSAKVVLTAIFPRGADANDPYRRRNAVVNKEIVKFADGKNIFWLDMNDQFLTCDGRLPREVFPDLLHPSDYGYELWAAAALPYAQAALAGTTMPPSRYAPFVRAHEVRVNESLTTYPVTRIERDGAGHDDWWLDRFLEHRNQISEAKGAFDLVFFGDSITHNWERPGKGKAVLDELRKTHSVLNLGYSGDRTEHLLWRGEHGELDGYKAKVVMLMIGTNNTWHRNDKPADIAAGIKKILALIARKQPQAKTLLLPIFPFGSSAKDPKRVNNEAVNAIIKGYADGRKVVWVDFNAKFLDAEGDNVKYMPDHCHPNTAGYRDIWLPSVMPYFK